MLTLMVFLDTNVFLYAVGRDHPLRLSCQVLLQRCTEGALRATTSTEVIQEILYVLSRRGEEEAGIRLARNTLLMFPDILPVRIDDARVACDLIERYPGLRARDAIHTATVVNNGMTTIVSADPHFDRIGEIRRLPPDDPSLI